MPSNNPLSYSTTNRILLLIDLTPFFRLENPKPYSNSIISSAKTLLSFPALSNSLSSFKFFFSSLSPLISSSTIRNFLSFFPSFTPNSIVFDHADKTLVSLCNAIDLIGGIERGSVSGSVSKAGFTSSSVAQVLHDYGWDSCDNENVNAVNGEDLTGVVRSNLVVLFSPICRSYNDLDDYLEDSDVTSKCDDVAFRDKFRRVFGSVRDSFINRDIHFSWVDVRYELGSTIDGESCELGDEYVRLLSLFRNGVNSLGWGFCSSSSIVLGSSLVSFGLIYPFIGVSSLISSDASNGKHKKISGQLNLEILDVNGKPLECKYCDLQLVDPKMLRGHRLNEFPLNWESEKNGRETSQQISETLERFGNGVVKIDVKGLCRHTDLMKIEEQISDVVLVKELLDSKKHKSEKSQQFFADRVLDLLSAESSKPVKGKSPPLWPILLSFLYRRGYWALVSLSNADGRTTMGVLKPFTVFSALLCIPKTNEQSSLENAYKISRPVDGMDSLSKQKKPRHKYKDLSWSSFYKAAFELCEMELEEACFFGGYESSKKLKFLKCWMKQVVKSSSSFRCKQDLLPSEENSEDRVSKSKIESDQPLVFPVMANAPPQREEVAPLPSEAAEAFFNNLPRRIQSGIESGVDLLAFAQRIVHSCIHWFSQKLGPQSNEEGEASVERSNDNCSHGLLVREIIKILLVEPKDVAARHKETNQASKATDSNPSINSSEDKIREYELQILFRMEILQSELASGIKETTAHSFVKQICSFLELIQCNIEDGFFGKFNLGDFVGRVISDRYKQNLASVVHKIYEQMDLLLFDDEDESPNPLLNSEDSCQSWKIRDNDGRSETNSLEDSFSGPSRVNEQTCEATRHVQKLVEAQEKRQRASRLSSFTRRTMPELQRVWAPKPPKLSRSNSESFRRPKRKSHRESYDNVCETPMSVAKKCLFPSEGSVDLDDSSPGMAKRVLFGDDLLQHKWRP